MPSSLPVVDATPPWDNGDLTTRPVTTTVKSLASEIFQRVCADVYSFGTRLPSERQLAEEFGVSRNTVRQALDLLEDYQIVARRAGSGSFVTFRPDKTAKEQSEPDDRENLPGFDEIAEMTSPLELNVVRTIVEPEMVRLAVINMSARDIGKLREIFTEMERIATGAAEFSYWDEQFHMQLARGTRNPLLIAIYRMINHVRNHAHWGATKEKTYSPQRIQEYQQQHRSILEAIEVRDIESAVEIIKLHMTELQRDLMLDI